MSRPIVKFSTNALNHDRTSEEPPRPPCLKRVSCVLRERDLIQRRKNASGGKENFFNNVNKNYTQTHFLSRDSVECKESFIPILKSENSRQPRLFLEHTDPYPTYNRRIRPDFDPVGGFNMYNNVREYHSPKIYYLPRAQELRCYTCCKPKDSNENFNYYDYTTQRPRPPVTRPPPPRPVTRPPRPATRPPTQDYTWVVTFSTARPTTR